MTIERRANSNHNERVMTDFLSDDELFRSVTLELFCGLDIGKALQRTVRTLRRAFPVDHAFLQIYEAGLGAMRTIAVADCDKTYPSDSLTPLPEETRTLVNENLSLFRDGSVHISDPDRNPVARDMLAFHEISDRSILNLILRTEKGRLGSLILTSGGEGLYEETDRNRLAGLFRPFSIALSNYLEQEELKSLRERLADDNRFLNRELIRRSGDHIVGADFGLRSVMERIRKVSSGDSPVLLTGETGVGKDVAAGAIHFESRRRSGPFIAVNCGAIPETLIDSELFGHEKGAFTGALSAKRGRFERAQGGTIFLDEIGEMPLSAQVRLLRVIQEKAVERVGGTAMIPIDVRIIAATNRNLPEMIREGKFREDLWYRINVFPIEIPPLRNRKSDLPALVDHFIGLKTEELKLPRRPVPAPGALETLAGYDWPGNIRELANVVERSIILSSDGLLHFHLEGSDSEAFEETGSPGSPFFDSLRSENFPTLDQTAARLIQRALELTGGKIHGPQGAGELLGVNPNTLRHRMRKLGIDFGRSS
jgi:transcriptional regulator with GAF, ATPase, and Fis domain